MRGFNLVQSVVKVFLLSIISIGLFSCASSNVSRTAAANVDKGSNNAQKLGDDLTGGDIVDSYQNSSQMAKGALLGGAAGAVVGAATTSVGFLPGLAVGTVFGASYGSYIDSETTLADQLLNRDVNVIELGDQLMVVVPSSRIFDGQSDKIKPTAYTTLNLIATYINSHTTELVKIAAYTDDIGTPSRNVALTRMQAKSVEKYLVATGVNTRVLYAEGYGGTNLIAKNTAEWGSSDNYRIEITMEKREV